MCVFSLRRQTNNSLFYRCGAMPCGKPTNDETFPACCDDYYYHLTKKLCP